jgi:hypothetical protein
MADPITILGAVAASAQLVELTVKALLKTMDLRHIPKKMAVLFEDVEKSTTRVRHIFSVLLEPGSEVFHQLDPTQFGSLSKVAMELRQAMDEVNTTLKPFVQPGGLGKEKASQRIWRSVMSVKLEKDVLEKLERIDRLNHQVNQQLAVTNVGLQAAAMGKLNTAEANSTNFQVTIREQHTSTTDRLDGIASTSRHVQQIMADIHTNVTGMSVDMSRMADDTMFIKDRLSTFPDSGRLETISRRQMQDLVSQQAKETRADILQLRDELLSVLTSNAVGLSSDSQRISSSLDEEDQMAVQKYARTQLLRYPMSLAEASMGIGRRGFTTRQPCRCRPFHQFRDTNILRLNLKKEEWSEHRPECPYAKSGRRSWTYSAKVTLMPFVNTTLELAVGATNLPGFWCIAPPLGFYGTVRRADSPLFQAFDRLPTLCFKSARVVPEEELDGDIRLETLSVAGWDIRMIAPMLHVESIRESSRYYVEWNIESAKCQLRDLCRLIRLESEQGRASGTDSDEHGTTLLFVSCKLSG